MRGSINNKGMNLQQLCDKSPDSITTNASSTNSFTGDFSSMATSVCLRIRSLLFVRAFVRQLAPLRSSMSLVLTVLLALPVASFAGDNKKSDPDAIGDRNVSGKVNWYSLEEEIALGKQLAQQVERQSKVINDPVVVE